MVAEGVPEGWLGLERAGEGDWTFTLTRPLCRLDDRFYGGTGMAVTAALMEAGAGRRALWATVQFLASAVPGERFDCRVDVLAAGRRSSQVRVAGRVGDRLVFSGIGAAGEPAAGALHAQFGAMPLVGAPEDCEPWRVRELLGGPGRTAPGWLQIVDARLADETGALWMRLRDRPLTRAVLPFLSDMVPNRVVALAGRSGAGTSLDNTLRWGADPEGDWVLVDVDPYMIQGGYVHGGARLWSRGGTLLGIASQTAGLVLLD